MLYLSDDGCLPQAGAMNYCPVCAIVAYQAAILLLLSDGKFKKGYKDFYKRTREFLEKRIKNTESEWSIRKNHEHPQTALCESMKKAQGKFLEKRQDIPRKYQVNS